MTENNKGEGFVKIKSSEEIKQKIVNIGAPGRKSGAGLGMPGPIANEAMGSFEAITDLYKSAGNLEQLPFDIANFDDSFGIKVKVKRVDAQEGDDYETINARIRFTEDGQLQILDKQSSTAKLTRADIEHTKAAQARREKDEAEKKAAADKATNGE